jgi:hypothetical protein
MSACLIWYGIVNGKRSSTATRRSGRSRHCGAALGNRRISENAASISSSSSVPRPSAAIRSSRPHDRFRRRRADGLDDSSTRARGSTLSHVRSIFVDRHRRRKCRRPPPRRDGRSPHPMRRRRRPQLPYRDCESIRGQVGHAPRQEDAGSRQACRRKTLAQSSSYRESIAPLSWFAAVEVQRRVPR